MTTKQRIEPISDLKQRWWTVTGIQLLIAFIGISVISFVSQGKEDVTPVIVRDEGESIKNSRFLPSITFLLSEMDEIQLAYEQVASIRELQANAKKEVLPIDKELRIRQKEFDEFMSSHKKKRLSMEEILREAKPVSETGSIKRAVVDRYAKLAQALLTDEQKTEAISLLTSCNRQGDKQRKNGGQI